MRARMRFPVLGAVAWLLATAGPGGAQTPTGQGPTPGQDPTGEASPPELPTGRVVLDEVIAVVGGRQIWRSTVEREFDALVSGTEVDGVTLSDAEKQALWAQVLRASIQQRMLAHGATTLGFASPDEVERYIDSQTMKEEQELIRRLGSIDSVLRELQYQNQSWDSWKAQIREGKLTDLALNEFVARRLDGKAPLFVTKKAMREFYEQYKETYWVRGPSASLEVIAFGAGSNGTAVSPAARARAAAGAWREGSTAQEVAGRYGGILNQDPWEFRSEGEDARLPFFREFALGNEAGAVSDPIPNAGTYWVLRVARKDPGSNLPFENREVQEYIQRELQNRIILGLRQETLSRSQSRTYVWMDPNSPTLIRR